MSVKDRAKQLNATGRDSKLSPNLGDQIRNAPTTAPKPAPSWGRQNGEAPSQGGRPSVPSTQTAVKTSPRPSQPSPRPSWSANQETPAPRPSASGPAALGPSAFSTPQASQASAPSGGTVTGGNLEQEVTNWLEAVSGERKGGQPLQEWLKDGQVLCRTVNKIQPGICPRINAQNMPFKQMENVSAFLQACRTLGVLEKDCFSTPDLFENKNMKTVHNCVASLGSNVRKTAPCFRGPYIGVAQNASVDDKARAKQTVTQDSGFRKDIATEVKGGVSKGRHM